MVIKSKRPNGEGKVVDHFDYTDGGTIPDDGQGSAAVHILYPGPIAGTIVLADGTVYNVTPDQVHCKTREHVTELQHHIWAIHKESGRFVVDGVTQMNHDCSEACGPLPS